MLAGDLAGSHDPSSQMHINKGCFFGFCFVFFQTDSTRRNDCKASRVGGEGEERGEDASGGQRWTGEGEGRERWRFRAVAASRLACLSPRRASWEAGPLVWECGLRSPGSCPNRPQGAACSSSWPWPCCNRPSQSTFAAGHKRRGRNSVKYKPGLSNVY